MNKKKYKSKVIFRFWKKDIIAIFPEELGDSSPYTCSSYMHIGQHGACDPNLIIDHSRLATPEEYDDLKEELEDQVGYNLIIIKRYRQDHLETRKQEFKNIEMRSK